VSVFVSSVLVFAVFLAAAAVLTVQTVCNVLVAQVVPVDVQDARDVVRVALAADNEWSGWQAI